VSEVDLRLLHSLTQRKAVCFLLRGTSRRTSPCRQPTGPKIQIANRETLCHWHRMWAERLQPSLISLAKLRSNHASQVIS